jgi:hypothetical protein
MKESYLLEDNALTISEYALKQGIPEPTVRSQVNAGKLNTRIAVRRGKEVKVIDVHSELPLFNNEPLHGAQLPVTIEHNESNRESNSDRSNDEVVKLREQLQELQQKLFEVSIENARYEERLARIPDQTKIVEVLESAIKAKDTTIDALNNERIVINAQLIKYRGPEADEGSIPANKPSRGPTKWFKFWE